MSTGEASLQETFERCRQMDASLAERLAIMADAVRKWWQMGTEAVDRLVKRLQQSGVGQEAPKVGDMMPSFLLPDETGSLVSLEELLRKGPVALTFHRGHWCPYCRININALAHAHGEIAPEGGQIVAIIPEREQFALELKSDAKADFPVLVDMDNAYAMSLGVAFWMGDELKQIMLENPDWDISSFQGNDSWVLPVPATFIVDRDGVITARFVDPDFRRRMSIEELLAALRKEI
jgi:peroxiredoxin